jgi:hypothetical protein
MRELKSIPYESIGKPGRRAPETDRDNAALQLCGYISVMLRFGPANDYRDELLKRVNKLRRAHGLGDSTFITETVAAPSISDTEFEATEAELITLMQESSPC